MTIDDIEDVLYLLEGLRSGHLYRQYPMEDYYLEIHRWYTRGDYAGVDYYPVSKEIFDHLIKHGFVEGVPRMGYIDKDIFQITRHGVEEINRMARIRQRREASERDRCAYDRDPDPVMDENLP
jgi:hypothetical protein